MQATLQVNVGCGDSPTPGWLNLDNSPAVRLGQLPGLGIVFRGTPVLGTYSQRLARVAAERGIRWADSRSLPLASGTVDTYYSSHMLEHVDHHYHGDSGAVLGEAFRVLRPGGRLRLVLPDLRDLARRYLSGEIDADRFMIDSCLTAPPPRRLAERLKAGLIGPRHHQWMYDADSLSGLVSTRGFASVEILEPGVTRIADPGALNLRERVEEGSIYLEAVRPPDDPPVSADASTENS